MRISDWSSDVCSSDLAKTLKKKSDERTMGAKSLSSVSAGAIPPSYKRVIDTAPYLSKSEEYDLSVRWRDHADKRAAERIVRAQLRMDIRMASKYFGTCLPIQALLSEGSGRA